jgi:hypothetical protein
MKMILPPITVYSRDLTNARAAIIDYFKDDFISTMNVDEQCVHFTFRKVDTNSHLEQIVNDLALGITFSYKKQIYKIHTQYFDI